jgi:hypothetical protein
VAKFGLDISKRQQYDTIQATLMKERGSFESHWRELADFIRPQRLRTLASDRNRGDKRNRRIIDSTATFALRTLISGMATGMSNPASPWFELGVPDPNLAKWGPVKEWLHDVTRIMYAVFASTNLYNAYPTLYGDEGTFGTGCMAIMEDSRDLFRCYPFPVGSYALGVSNRGTVDTFVHEYQMTVAQIVEQFVFDAETGKFDWSVCSPNVKKLWDQHDYETNVDVCWIVSPNRDADEYRVEAKHLPFYSCHFEKGHSGFLKESGFNEFPIVAPRWDAVVGDIYGSSCPAMDALGDIQQLQVETKRKGQALEKMVNPPLQGPSQLKQISLLPGEYNALDALNQDKGIRPVHEVSLSIGDLRVDIEDVRFLIRRAFYEDLFLMIASSPSPQKTAREIEERHEEKFWALSQVVERNNDELHEPTFDRIFPMMERAGMLPEPPQELLGVRLTLNYVSMLNRALKLVRIGPVDRFIQTTLAVAPIAPEVLDKVNWAEVMNEYADMTGVPPKMLRSDDEAAQIAQQRQQQQAQMMAAEQAQMQAKAAKDLGTTPMDQNTALDTVMQGE